MKQIWSQERIPSEWRRSVIVPIFKKGNPTREENYRGITLLCTAYNVYTEALRRKLEEEIEERKLIPPSQAGFRKGRSTIDNIYILDHIIQREGLREESKMYALFVDLRAAFDSINTTYEK